MPAPWWRSLLRIDERPKNRRSIDEKTAKRHSSIDSTSRRCHPCLCKEPGLQTSEQRREGRRRLRTRLRPDIQSAAVACFCLDDQHISPKEAFDALNEAAEVSREMRDRGRVGLGGARSWRRRGNSSRRRASCLYSSRASRPLRLSVKKPAARGVSELCEKRGEDQTSLFVAEDRVSAHAPLPLSP
ncbi:hypothetical protein BCR35DRAFT_18629 [Leucosporidium creatinivorum]|uniref:Uncharacterized protein n=1 Tax=Leucosporidium creatinivorum TaxID=106004 RepID=A0A1Y2D0M6_9BASI|nr:hypothetical protein BCR35DRAFT_18629 [Leucosporidium creatinivorum]